MQAGADDGETNRRLHVDKQTRRHARAERELEQEAKARGKAPKDGVCATPGHHHHCHERARDRTACHHAMLGYAMLLCLIVKAFDKERNHGQ